MHKYIALLTFSAVALTLTPHSDASLIMGSIGFNADNGTTVSSFSQTVSALSTSGRAFDFTFNVAVSSTAGTVIESTSGAGGLGVDTGAGGASQFSTGDDLTFVISISGVDAADTWAPLLETLSFTYLNLQGATDALDSGRISTPALNSFTDIDAGPGQFTGHIASSLILGGTSNEVHGGVRGFQSFSTAPATVSSGVNFGTGFGVDLPATNAGYPVTTFTIFNSGTGNYRIGAIGFQIEANPEPSSIVLGCVCLAFCATPFARRRLKRLIAGEAPATVA